LGQSFALSQLNPNFEKKIGLSWLNANLNSIFGIESAQYKFDEKNIGFSRLNTENVKNQKNQMERLL